MKGKFAATLLASLVICAAVCPQAISASANSGDSYWYSDSSTGIYLYNETCPLQIKSENLTFNITGLPMDGYTQNYTSSVCADYNFYNPTDSAITAHLLFPFGRQPIYYDDIKDTSDLDSLYGVTIDGEDANADIRYTFYSSGNFIFETEIEYLHDTKQENDGFDENSTVTKITFGETEHEYVQVNYTIDPDKTIIILDEYEDYTRTTSGENLLINIVFNSSETTEFYILGEMPEQFSVYGCDMETGGENGRAYVKFNPVEEIAYFSDDGETLDSFVQQFNLFGDGAYSEVDWFNFSLYFITVKLGIYSTYYNSMSNYLYYANNFFADDLGSFAMRWYSYDLTVQAKSYAQNTVTAPIYPSVDVDYEPYKYDFVYLLSPAATWDSFENLTITVNAPYYMLESSVEFTMTGSVEDGTAQYTATLASLPEDELTFTLCESADPDKEFSAYTVIAVIFFIILTAILVFIIGGSIAAIVFLIVYIVRKNKKKQ